MSGITGLYTFCFTIVYTDRIFNFTFEPETTIKNFIEYVSNRMREIEPNHSIEIIESGQYYNINGKDPEMAPKLNYCYEYTLRDVFRNRLRNTSFFIRLI